MAKATKAEKAYAKKYYNTHPKQKAKKIKKQIQKQKDNPETYAKAQRERYRTNPEYRAYKIKYAKTYYRNHYAKKK